MMCVEFTVANTGKTSSSGLVLGYAAAFYKLTHISQPLHLPLAMEAGEAGLAGEELLHGGLLEVTLLGDEPVQSTQQPIHIAQRLRDGALFREGWKSQRHSQKCAF